mgnify:CR=1 FL=1
MRVYVLVVIVGGLACQQGSKGDVGAQGPQGTPGPDGSTGPTGPQGPAGERGPQGEQGLVGATGMPGQVVVVATADGGAVLVDGGIAIVAGPAGPQGPPGAAGQVVVISAIDGGAIAIDGGVAIVTGPPGPPGSSQRMALRAPDGGAVGHQYGFGTFVLSLGCFAWIDYDSTPMRWRGLNWGNNIGYTTASCAGPPYLVTTVNGTNWYFPTHCFEDAFENLYRVKQPLTNLNTRGVSWGRDQLGACVAIPSTSGRSIELVTLPPTPIDLPLSWGLE